MSRHRKKTDLEQVALLAAAPGRYLHLQPGQTAALQNGLVDSTVQVSIPVDTSAGQPWRWMDAARDAFAAVRATTVLPVELWLTDGGMDALCLLALQPEVLSVPVQPDALTDEAAESLLRCFRQFEVVPVFRVGPTLPAEDSPVMRAMQAYARPCWIHVDAPSFQDLATPGAAPGSVWPLVRVQRSSDESIDGGSLVGNSSIMPDTSTPPSYRTVDTHRALLGCTDVREPCG